MARVPVIIAAILVSATPAKARADDVPEPPVAEPPEVAVPAPADAPFSTPPRADAPPAPVQPVAPPLPAARSASTVAVAGAPTPVQPLRETHGLALSAGFGIAYGFIQPRVPEKP